MTTATIAPEALELADLAGVIRALRVDALDSSVQLFGDVECKRHLGRVEMAREIEVIVRRRIATLTGAGE